MGGRSGMSLLDRVRALLGDDAVEIAGGADAVPRVAPASPDAVALLLGTAREEGWRVRLEGAGTWLPADAPADLALTTRRLDRVPAVEPQDLSATAEAGIGCDLLRQQLADHGTVAPRLRRGARPHPRRHLRHGRWPAGAERWPRRQERRRVRSHEARGGRVRRIRRDRARAPPAPRPAPRRPDVRARGDPRGPDATGRGRRRGRLAAGGA